MVLGGIVCGMIADKWQCHSKVVASVCLISLAAISAKPVVSVYYGNPETNQCPSMAIAETGIGMNGTLKAIACINNTNQNENCTSTNVESNENNTNSKPNYDSHTLYILMFVINFCFQFCEGAGLAFVDTNTVRRIQLASRDRPIEYGRQRMFSAIGAMLGIFITNLSADFFPTNSKVTCYAGIFVVYGIYTLLFCIFTLVAYHGLSFREETEEGEEDKEIGNINYAEDEIKGENGHQIPNKPEAISFETPEKTKKEQENEPTNADFWKIFFKTILQFDTFFFYLTTFISGLQYSQFMSFAFVYLKELNAPSSLLTLSIMLAALMSAFLYVYALNIIKFLGGKWRSMMFSFLMYFVRYLGISLIENPWLVLIFQLLHGVSFSLYLVAGLVHLEETSPLPVLTSLVSMFNSIHFGLGTFIGSSISGVIYQRYGGRALFRYTALLSIVWFCVLAVYVFFKERRERKNPKDKSEIGKALMKMTIYY